MKNALTSVLRYVNARRTTHRAGRTSDANNTDISLHNNDNNDGFHHTNFLPLYKKIELKIPNWYLSFVFFTATNGWDNLYEREGVWGTCRSKSRVASRSSGNDSDHVVTNSDLLSWSTNPQQQWGTVENRFKQMSVLLTIVYDTPCVCLCVLCVCLCVSAWIWHLRYQPGILGLVPPHRCHFWYVLIPEKKYKSSIV